MYELKNIPISEYYEYVKLYNAEKAKKRRNANAGIGAGLMSENLE